MSNPRQGRRPSPPGAPTPKLTVQGRNSDGLLKLKVGLPAGISRTVKLLRGSAIRALQFEGEIIAEIEMNSGKANAGGVAVVQRAAIYRTRGGNFVSEFSTVESSSGERIGKAHVFGTLDDACDWFGPGHLNTELLKKLGRWEPEIIE